MIQHRLERDHVRLNQGEGVVTRPCLSGGPQHPFSLSSVDEPPCCEVPPLRRLFVPRLVAGNQRFLNAQNPAPPAARRGGANARCANGSAADDEDEQREDRQHDQHVNERDVAARGGENHDSSRWSKGQHLTTSSAFSVCV